MEHNYNLGQTSVIGREKMKTKIETVETSSGNVFADLGFHNGEAHLLKAKLATRIAQLDRSEGLDPCSDSSADSFGSTKSVAALARTAFRPFSRSFICRSESARS